MGSGAVRTHLTPEGATRSTCPGPGALCSHPARRECGRGVAARLRPRPTLLSVGWAAVSPVDVRSFLRVGEAIGNASLVAHFNGF